MVEKFEWRVERDIGFDPKYRVIEVQFGDGYKQVSADGINTKEESFQIRVTAKSEDEAEKIMAFFDRHSGYKSFLWKPPLGKLGLYLCQDPKPMYQGGDVYVITGTFVKSFSSNA